MKSILLRILAPAFAAALMSSCANITFIGHERAYDLNVALKADMSEPLSSNLGFESKTALAVPPEESMPFADLFNRLKVHKGNVLPTISRLDATRVNSDGKGFDGVNYLSVLATGRAAVLAARGQGTTTSQSSSAPAGAGGAPAPPTTSRTLGGGSSGNGFLQAAAAIASDHE